MLVLKQSVTMINILRELFTQKKSAENATASGMSDKSEDVFNFCISFSSTFTDRFYTQT
mgnify:CR=1 FL=1